MTPPERFVALVTEHLDAEAVDRLATRCIVRHASPEDGPRFDAALGEADALIVRTYTRVDRDLLERAPRLRVVGRAGVGLDSIDVAACRDRGVAVVHTPEANAGAVREWVMAALLATLRPLPRIPDGGADAAQWRELREQALAPRSLEELTVGIVGFGRVGRRVAAAMHAMGARVLAHDLQPIDPEVAAAAGATIAAIEQVHASSDIVSLHVDGRAANRGLYGAARLAQLREDAILINASRGFVVDPAALANLLETRPAMRAILDVHEPEPVPPGHPLLGHPRAILTPHVASRTAAAQRAMSAVVEDVVRVLEGRAPRWPAPIDPGFSE